MQSVIESGMPRVTLTRHSLLPTSHIWVSNEGGQRRLVTVSFIRTGRVRSIRQECNLCSQVTPTSSSISNRTLIGRHDFATANGGVSSDNRSPARLLIGWISDLEQWLDVRVSKIANSFRWNKQTTVELIFTWAERLLGCGAHRWQT